MFVTRDLINSAKRPSLSSLLDAGLLSPGESFVLVANGAQHFGRLLADGNVEASGEVFTSLSAWTRKVTGVVRNPWPIVYARGQTLDQIRKSASIPSGPPSHQPSPVRPFLDNYFLSHS